MQTQICKFLKLQNLSLTHLLLNHIFYATFCSYQTKSAYHKELSSYRYIALTIYILLKSSSLSLQYIILLFVGTNMVTTSTARNIVGIIGMFNLYLINLIHFHDWPEWSLIVPPGGAHIRNDSKNFSLFLWVYLSHFRLVVYMLLEFSEYLMLLFLSHRKCHLLLLICVSPVNLSLLFLFWVCIQYDQTNVKILSGQLIWYFRLRVRVLNCDMSCLITKRSVRRKSLGCAPRALLKTFSSPTWFISLTFFFNFSKKLLTCINFVIWCELIPFASSWWYSEFASLARYYLCRTRQVIIPSTPSQTSG